MTKYTLTLQIRTYRKFGEDDYRTVETFESFEFDNVLDMATLFSSMVRHSHSSLNFRVSREEVEEVKEIRGKKDE